jgi:spore coat assembly protein SafA
MADTYVVQQGDTLSGIAQKFGVSLSDLEAANPQITNPDLIVPGQLINIPDSGSGDDGDGDGPKSKDNKDQKDKEGKEFKDKDKEGKEFKDKDKEHKDKDKDHKDKDHKDHKDKEHKDQKDHKDKEHKDHKEHPEKHDHEKQHEGHGGSGSGVTGAHAVSLGSGGTPSMHFIGAELRPDLVHTTLGREPDLSGGAEGMAGQSGGTAAAKAGD